MTNTNELRKEIEKLIQRCAQCDKEPEVCTGCFYFVDQIMQLLAKHESEPIKLLRGWVDAEDRIERIQKERGVTFQEVQEVIHDRWYMHDKTKRYLTKNSKGENHE